MAFALEHSEKPAKWANSLAVLKGHDSRDLMKMSEVVSSPRCQQLRKSDSAESRMASASLKVGRADVQSSQGLNIFRAQASERIQQLSDRLAFDISCMALAV